MTARSQRFTRSRSRARSAAAMTAWSGEGPPLLRLPRRPGAFARCTREEKAGGLLAKWRRHVQPSAVRPLSLRPTHGEPAASVAQERRETPAAGSFPSFASLVAALRRQYGEGPASRTGLTAKAPAGKRFACFASISSMPKEPALKTYRPCHRGEDGRWRLAKPSGPLPLYNLPAVLAAPAEAIIPVLEGEKCVEIAIGLGLPYATTSAHGASAAAHRLVAPGGPARGHSPRRRGERRSTPRRSRPCLPPRPPAEVPIVRLPGLGDGDDIEQWRTHTPEPMATEEGHPRAAHRPDREWFTSASNGCIPVLRRRAWTRVGVPEAHRLWRPSSAERRPV